MDLLLMILPPRASSSCPYLCFPKTYSHQDRFGSVDKSGRYSSPLASQARRFAATLGELTGGRVGLTCGSVGLLKGAVTIAVR